MAGIGVSGFGGGGAAVIRVVMDFSRVRGGLARLQRKMGNMREPLKKSAIDYMAGKVIKQRFIAQGIPRWKKHAPATIKKWGIHKILNLTGKLRESATGGSGSWIRYKPSSRPKSVAFGSNVEYASVHDQARGTITMSGRGNRTPIPGRPWTQVTQRNAEYMRDILLRWTRKKLRESGIGR